MKRRMFMGSLKDENTPKFICPVCSNIGFAYEHICGKPCMRSELCRICGFDAENTLDKEKWYQAWKECGSELLFDKPFDERCEYMDKIQDAYLRMDYCIPTDQEVIKRNISERAYLQNGFQHVIDNKKMIVVECNGSVSTFPYETNRIIDSNENGSYIAICEKENLHYLFLSKHFCYNDEVIRSSYIGLTPEVFYISMIIENPCMVEDNSGNSYRIWLKK